jgi:hypothetical protein
MEIRRRTILVGIASVVAASTVDSFAQGALPADLKTKIIRSIGAQPETVEIGVAGNIVTVLRVNSNMNQSSHAGRDNEANAIAPLVAQVILAAPEFKNVHTIRVQYVSRRAAGGADTVIDTVDFRKTSSGSFEFHQT